VDTTEKQQYKESQVSQESYITQEEIDIAQLVKEAWQQKKTILYTTLIFFFVGIFVAIFLPEEYTSEITLMPQTSGTASEGIGAGLLKQFGLGGVSGISGTSGGTISTNLYPDITQSTPFSLKIMEKSFYFSKLDTTASLITYFNDLEEPNLLDNIKRYTLGLPKIIIGFPIKIANLFRNSEPSSQLTPISSSTEKSHNAQELISLTSEDSLYKPLVVTKEQRKIIGELNERIVTSVEPNGTVLISVTMPDPQVAAAATETAAILLTSYIKEYRINKALEDLSFIEKQFRDKEARYNDSQTKLAEIRDRNANIATEKGKIELERAQTEFSLAYSLYQSIAQQLEQARIKVQEETPLFKVLEPAQVPLKKSAPKEELIIIGFIAGGFFIGFAIVIAKIIFSQVRPNFK